MKDAIRELRCIIRQVKLCVEAEGMYGCNEVVLPGGDKALPLKVGKSCLVDNSKEHSKEAVSALLKKRVYNCSGCPLHRTRNNVVFGDGTLDAKLVFVGEAPGYEEDMQGLPFVGRAGKLLTKMIEAIGLSRDKVYICNVLKCRPPNNRSPLPEEVNACKGYLLKQIELISPKVICSLGRYAAAALLNTDDPISKIRGKEIDFNGVVLIPTFHPAYLLRNPAGKRDAWEDLKKVKKLI